MDRDSVISIIRSHKAEFQDLGVSHLSLFGSTAYSVSATAPSTDVDVAVTLAPSSRGFARIEVLDAVKSRLSTLLERPVDVVEEPARHPRLQRAIERHRKIAF